MAAPCKSTPTEMLVDIRHQTNFTLFKSHTWKGSEFEVTNSGDGAAVIMQVEIAHIGYHNLRSLRLVDPASRRPVIAVEEFDAGGSCPRWEGFRGDSTSGSDRLFLAVRTILQGSSSTGLQVQVFLGGNSSGAKQQAPDLVLRGCYIRGSMTVSRGGGGGEGDDKHIAKIGRTRSKVDAHDEVGENMYTVTIEPGVDQALVLALTVVVDQMHDKGTYCACCCQHDCLRKRRVHRH